MLFGLVSRHYVGFPDPAVFKKAGYRTKTLCLEYNGISLYGKAFLTDGDGPFPTVLYAHGAESDYKADMTTLKSLAMSGVACYTFDFYGWTSRSTMLQGVHRFHDMTFPEALMLMTPMNEQAAARE